MEKHHSYILALDPATKTGWAVRNDESGSIVSGVWDLSTGRHEGGGMRFLRFRAKLNEVFELQGKPRFVAYEEVSRHLGTTAAHVYGGLIAEATELCESLSIPYTAYPVGTIKKFATGKGNAGKAKMIKAAEKQWPGHTFEDDNEADARWIAELAYSKLPKKI